MKKLILTALCVGLLVVTSGCANCGLRQWFKGAPCNTCNPAFGKPPANVLSNCENGNCGLGGTCATGNCPTGNATLGKPQIGPAMNSPVIPAQNVQPPVFGTPNGVPYYSDPNLNSATPFQPTSINPPSYQYGNPPVDQINYTGSMDNSILPPNAGSAG